MGSCGSVCNIEGGAIFVGDWGFSFRFHAKDEIVGDAFTGKAPALDISAFTALRVDFVKPDGTTAFLTQGTTPAVALVDGGLEGAFEVRVDDALLDTAGTWKMSGSVTLPDRRWSSRVVCFEVLPRLI